MDEKYFAKKIEAKWQQKWKSSDAFKVTQDVTKPKFYQLEMLPYPSGNLHMGHVRNYAAGDAVAWYKRLKGFNVFHPIGWDSFGQPAEDAAIKRGVNPREWTEENIQAMRGQLERLGLSYDWSCEIAAHRPEYYKFDQWFFLKMYEMGLAYKKKTQVNWCETDQATLSNEQASGGLCWRCGNPVTKKDLEQWFFKTTAYTGELVDQIETLRSGWPASVLKRQSDWIGRSEGAFVDFEVPSGEENGQQPEIIRVFTTRIDTIYGASAVVVASEHPLIIKHWPQFSLDVHEKIEQIRAEKMNPTDHATEAVKDGIDTGLKAVNPFSREEIPVWVGNYVMMDYGTGAVMSVPAHDERDLDFAKTFGLPVIPVVTKVDAETNNADKGSEKMSDNAPFLDPGILVNSAQWSGKTSEEAKQEMIAFAVEKGFGEAATTYRLRDWGISRQRFWGAPIPIIYCETCGIVPEKYENLPVRLPETAPFTGKGESPLKKVPEFVSATCPKCDGTASRETDTMDTFVDSSWYYFRYLDAHNDSLPFDPEQAAYWTPVDQYIGGDDHAVMHLIYTRFWTKVMRDIGLLKIDEPVKSLLTQGMVVGETFFDESTGKRKYFPPSSVNVERDQKGRITIARSPDGDGLKYAIERMSKSKGNGVDPDEMVEIYGADAARLFILFAAPIENELFWNESGIEGGVRFLQRLWRMVWKWEARIAGSKEATSSDSTNASRKLRQKTHQTIQRVGESLENLQFNTPVASLMELSNALSDSGLDPETASEDEVFAVAEAIKCLALMLAPYTPHFAEEIFSVVIGNEEGMIANNAIFPVFDPQIAKADEIEMPVQVNGKVRSKLMVSPEISDDVLKEAVMQDAKIKEYTDGREVLKVIIVPKRLVNVVIKG